MMKTGMRLEDDWKYTENISKPNQFLRIKSLKPKMKSIYIYIYFSLNFLHQFWNIVDVCFSSKYKCHCPTGPVRNWNIVLQNLLDGPDLRFFGELNSE